MRSPAPPSLTRSPSRSEATLEAVADERLASTETSSDAAEPFGLGGIGSPSGSSLVLESLLIVHQHAVAEVAQDLDAHPVGHARCRSAPGAPTGLPRQPSPGASRTVRPQSPASPPPVTRNAAPLGMFEPSSVAAAADHGEVLGAGQVKSTV